MVACWARRIYKAVGATDSMGFQPGRWPSALPVCVVAAGRSGYVYPSVLAGSECGYGYL